jgi:hypothetical protein
MAVECKMPQIICQIKVDWKGKIEDDEKSEEKFREWCEKISHRRNQLSWRILVNDGNVRESDREGIRGM